MPTILQKIITKKTDILSKILKINSNTIDFSNSSPPNTQLIGKIQERLNNPLFELSISDFEVMCGDRMILRMMTKILECDEKQLNKFCKYINVFKENINLSPESIKNKMKSKISLKSLPKHLLENIIGKYKDLFPNKYVLLSWIPVDKIDYKSLSLNPNAIDFIKKVLISKNKYKIDWNNLSENPNAIELLRKYPNKIIYLNLSSNPNAIELLKENYNKINWEYLSLNPNAIEMLRDKINEENEMNKQDLDNLHSDKRANWYNLSSNPNAIELLREKINKEKKMSKQELERLDSGKKINWNNLSSNPNAIELLRENPTEIDWVSIHTNVNSIDFLKENPHKILWGLLSENPNAIDFLKENPSNIDYKNLSLNPNAIELLKANQHNINWNNLSQNPNAIELLKANQNKINWRYLSGNPNAIELLQLRKEKMDMRLLSANPSIFQAVKKVNTFETINDIMEWCKNPEIHPINKTPMNATGKEYKKIYEIAYVLMKKYKETDRNIKNLFPKNHILFGNVDIINYMCLKKYEKLQGDYYDTTVLSFLTENIKNTEEQPTIFETELEILRNVFSNQGRYLNLSNFIMKLATLISKITTLFIENEYSSFDKIMEDVSCDKTVTILHFLRNNKLNNGEIIMDYINDYDGIIHEDVGTEWISDVKKIIANYDLTGQDIKDYYDVNSGIIINAENKKYLPIDDPLDYYFDKFEEKLAEISKPIYSKLIDLTTFKPKELRNYLNDEEYSKYKKEKDAYDVSKKKYNEAVLKDSSLVPPEKPKILLPWGKMHIIGREIDPNHIKDDVIIRFNEEYLKVTPIIEEYNRIKNMSYIELKKYSRQSSSSSDKKLINDNEILSMTREEINNNILFDNSDLEDKCSESIDILTNEELNDDNYPLSKLQLMVRLKVYTSDKKKYRTECIYAPKLYNYLIKCINEKEPFINPVTKTKYTEENIQELMTVMKIIDTTIERPIFIKHMNDSKLKINYRLIKETYNDNGVSGPLLSFYNIYLTREIGVMNYEVHNICTIPSDIESSLSINNARFETGSNDLTSYIMLFRIFKLFNEGRLLYRYTQPYKIPSTIPNEYLYVKPKIHFNKYKKAIQWYYNKTTEQYRTSEEYVEMFKHYCEEINSYIY